MLTHVCPSRDPTGLDSLEGDLKGKYYALKNMTEEEQQQLIDDHFLFDKPVSPLLLASGMARDWPDGRGIWSVPHHARGGARLLVAVAGVWEAGEIMRQIIKRKKCGKEDQFMSITPSWSCSTWLCPQLTCLSKVFAFCTEVNGT